MCRFSGRYKIHETIACCLLGPVGIGARDRDGQLYSLLFVKKGIGGRLLVCLSFCLLVPPNVLPLSLVLHDISNDGLTVFHCSLDAIPPMDGLHLQADNYRTFHSVSLVMVVSSFGSGKRKNGTLVDNDDESSAVVVVVEIFVEAADPFTCKSISSTSRKVSCNRWSSKLVWCN